MIVGQTIFLLLTFLSPCCRLYAESFDHFDQKCSHGVYHYRGFMHEAIPSLFRSLFLHTSACCPDAFAVLMLACIFSPFVVVGPDRPSLLLESFMNQMFITGGAVRVSGFANI